MDWFFRTPCLYLQPVQSWKNIYAQKSHTVTKKSLFWNSLFFFCIQERSISEHNDEIKKQSTNLFDSGQRASSGLAAALLLLPEVLLLHRVAAVRGTRTCWREGAKEAALPHLGLIGKTWRSWESGGFMVGFSVCSFVHYFLLHSILLLI